MQQLQKIEEDIANARKYYNAVVKNYNIKLQSFPSSIIGSLFHYSKKAMYEAYDDERAAVKVDFSKPTAAEVVEAAADLRADMDEAMGEAKAAAEGAAEAVEQAVRTQEQ